MGHLLSNRNKITPNQGRGETRNHTNNDKRKRRANEKWEGWEQGGRQVAIWVCRFRWRCLGQDAHSFLTFPLSSSNLHLRPSVVVENREGKRGEIMEAKNISIVFCVRWLLSVFGVLWLLSHTKHKLNEKRHATLSLFCTNGRFISWVCSYAFRKWSTTKQKKRLSLRA